MSRKPKAVKEEKLPDEVVTLDIGDGTEEEATQEAIVNSVEIHTVKAPDDHQKHVDLIRDFLAHNRERSSTPLVKMPEQEAPLKTGNEAPARDPYTCTLQLHVAVNSGPHGVSNAERDLMVSSLRAYFQDRGIGEVERGYHAGGEFILIAHGWDAATMKDTIRAVAGAKLSGGYYRQSEQNTHNNNRCTKVVPY